MLSFSFPNPSIQNNLLLHALARRCREGADAHRSLEHVHTRNGRRALFTTQKSAVMMDKSVGHDDPVERIRFDRVREILNRADEVEREAREVRRLLACMRERQREWPDAPCERTDR